MNNYSREAWLPGKDSCTNLSERRVFEDFVWNANFIFLYEVRFKSVNNGSIGSVHHAIKASHEFSKGLDILDLHDHETCTCGQNDTFEHVPFRAILPRQVAEAKCDIRTCASVPIFLHVQVTDQVLSCLGILPRKQQRFLLS